MAEPGKDRSKWFDYVMLIVLLIFAVKGTIEAPINALSKTTLKRMEQLYQNEEAFFNLLEQCGYSMDADGSNTNTYYRVCSGNSSCTVEGEHEAEFTFYHNKWSDVQAFRKGCDESRNRKDTKDADQYLWTTNIYVSNRRITGLFDISSTKRKCACAENELQRLISTAEALGIMQAE